MPDKEQFISRLNTEGIYANESLGQHFLIEDFYLEKISSFVSRGSTVIEVGSGPGNLTELLASRASNVLGIEIDRKFQPMLEEIQSKHQNVEILYADVLKTNLKRYDLKTSEEVQIIASLPFHITEPFLTELININIANAVLVLGDEVTREIYESPKSLSFGRLSLLTQTFFDTSIVANIPKTAFYPQPRTDASIVSFVPKSRREINSSPSNAVFANLFRNSRKNGLVINEVKQALVNFQENGTLSKRESHQRERANVRRELRNMKGQGYYNYSGRKENDKNSLVLSQSHALDIIARMGISEDVLKKPFSRLDNQEIRELVAGVRQYFD